MFIFFIPVIRSYKIHIALTILRQSLYGLAQFAILFLYSNLTGPALIEQLPDLLATRGLGITQAFF
jgi:hypothetical protein